MLHRRSLFAILLVPLLTLALAGCVTRQDDDSTAGDRTVPTPEPTPTESVDETTPEPTVEPTETPVPDDPEDWYELLITEKTYPEAEIGEQVLELAESEAEFEELWDWFQLHEVEDAPVVDWDSRVVLFAGTGESSGCPLIIDSVYYDNEEQFVGVAATQDVPEDTMCTMDWTPRVFVLSLDAETLSDGELRAAVYDTEAIGQINPEDGEIIRDAK